MFKKIIFKKYDEYFLILLQFINIINNIPLSRLNENEERREEELVERRGRERGERKRG